MILRRILLWPWKGLSTAVRDCVDGLQHLITSRETQSIRRGPDFIVLLQVFIGMIVSWWIYVPVHELLHAAGCMVTGGAVIQLDIAPHYGGYLLAHIFPFIKAGGEYAGRLVGFETGGSDLGYLFTVFAPYLLTLIFGAMMLRSPFSRRYPLLFGAGLIIAFAPIIGVTGDYYEMGSILITRVMGSLFPSSPWEAFRSDDVFRLLQEIVKDPAAFNIHGFFSKMRATMIIVTSFALGLFLAGLTYLGSVNLLNFFGQKNKKARESIQV